MWMVETVAGNFRKCNLLPLSVSHLRKKKKKGRIPRSAQSHLAGRRQKPLGQKVIISECCVAFYFEQKVKEQGSDSDGSAPALYGRHTLY